NFATLLVPVLTVTVNAAFWAAGWIAVRTAILTWVGAQLLSSLFLAVYVGVRLGGYGRPHLRLAPFSVSFGLETHAGAVMMMGNYRLDQWIVGAVSGPRELGLYSIAVAWTEALFFLGQAVGTVQRPDLVRATRERAAALAAAAFRASALLTAPLALV